LQAFRDAPRSAGLRNTAYSYAELKTAVGKEVQVSFKVTNTGKRAGAEIAQVYASLPATTGEPPKRLIAWEKIQLRPAENKTVTLTLDPLHLSIFNADKDQWELLPGDYVIFVGESSRSTPLHQAVYLGSSDVPQEHHLGENAGKCWRRAGELPDVCHVCILPTSGHCDGPPSFVRY
jgi:hypothetical protein